MAHSCPECGSICYCGGDIDDICLEGTAAEARCDCCITQRVEGDEVEADGL